MKGYKEELTKMTANDVTLQKQQGLILVGTLNSSTRPQRIEGDNIQLVKAMIRAGSIGKLKDDKRCRMYPHL